MSGSSEKRKNRNSSADDGFRFNDHHHVTPVGQNPRKDHPQQSICPPQRWPWRGPLDRGELVAKRQELQLEDRAATETIAEQRKNGEKDDCIHARDAIQPRSKTPGFLWPMRFSGATTVIMKFPNVEIAQQWHHDPDYIKLVEHRHRSANANLALVEGMD